MTHKLAIFYLTDYMRHYTFDFFCKNLEQSKYKQDIVVVILTHTDDEQFYRENLTKYGLSFVIKRVAQENNYLGKMRAGLQYTFENNIPYCMKLDNDVLIFPSMYDFIVENQTALENPEIAFLTPMITNGIPTVEDFLDEFVEEEDRKKVRAIFKEYRFSNNIWGVGVDGTPLNQWIESVNEWDGKEFFNQVRKMNHYYQGIHPVRLNHNSLVAVNELVLKNIKKISSPTSIEAKVEVDFPYFCCNIYVIKPKTLLAILDDTSLFVDPFEEVPINRYRANNKLKVITTKNGCVVHMIYNSLSNHLEYERTFLNRVVTALDSSELK